jgi:hypothetical protein
MYEFDGTPMNAMYLAYSPPQMLPTTTLNPTSSATSTSKAKAKRGLVQEEEVIPLNINAKHIKRGIEKAPVDANLIWWTGIGMTLFGGVAYML